MQKGEFFARIFEMRLRAFAFGVRASAFDLRSFACLCVWCACVGVRLRALACISTRFDSSLDDHEFFFLRTIFLIGNYFLADPRFYFTKPTPGRKRELGEIFSRIAFGAVYQ